MAWNRSWKNKYSNVKSGSTLRELIGRRFDSGLERDRAAELVLLQRAGEIRNLQFQQTTHLTDARIGYRPDFQYEEKPAGFKDWRTVFEDAKGFETEVWGIKKRLWRYYGLGILRITKRSGGRIRVVEEISPQCRKNEQNAT